MSWDEQEAASDAFYEQITEEAIGDFTADRLRSYYRDHLTTMQPALRTLHEASRLLNSDHMTAATAFAAAAVELFLKNSILHPLIYGLIHNENMATVVVDYTLGQTGFYRYEPLLKNLFREVAALDFGAVQRVGAHKSLIEECKDLAKQRNRIVHQGTTANRQDAESACKVAEAVYWLYVAKMLEALGFYIFDDGVISGSEYTRPVPTVRNQDGVRVIAEPITLSRYARPTLAGTTIPVPPVPMP